MASRSIVERLDSALSMEKHISEMATRPSGAHGYIPGASEVVLSVGLLPRIAHKLAVSKRRGQPGRPRGGPERRRLQSDGPEPLRYPRWTIYIQSVKRVRNC